MDSWSIHVASRSNQRSKRLAWKVFLSIFAVMGVAILVSAPSNLGKKEKGPFSDVLRVEREFQKGSEDTSTLAHSFRRFSDAPSSEVGRVRQKALSSVSGRGTTADFEQNRRFDPKVSTQASQSSFRPERHTGVKPNPSRIRLPGGGYYDSKNRGQSMREKEVGEVAAFSSKPFGTLGILPSNPNIIRPGVLKKDDASGEDPLGGGREGEALEPLASPFEYDLIRFGFGAGLSLERQTTLDFFSQVARYPDTQEGLFDAYPEQTFSLGHGGWIDIRVRDGKIVDQKDSEDLVLYLAKASSGDAVISVISEAGKELTPSWTVSVDGNTEVGLDLAHLGFQEARVLRIRDVSFISAEEANTNVNMYAGLDLDAIVLKSAFRIEENEGSEE